MAKLEGHSEQVYSLDWSPDGKHLVSASASGTILKWSADDLTFNRVHEGFKNIIWKVAWSPSGKFLCTVEDEGSVRLWLADQQELFRYHREKNRQIFCAAWSPNSDDLAYGCSDGVILISDSAGEELHREFCAESYPIRTLAWSPDGKRLASGSIAGTIDIWDVAAGRRIQILEGHTARIFSVIFSADGRLFASKADDNTVRLWRCDTWEIVAVLKELTSGIQLVGGLAFNPKDSEFLLASRSGRDSVVKIWRLDYPTLLNATESYSSQKYRNARVLLVGNTGVGKSGLSLVLTGQRFEATESTHGRHIRVMDTSKVLLPNGDLETREILLWDLAGQRNYNLIHLLHLKEATVALAVFDPCREADPFAGIHYWSRAINQYCRPGNNGMEVKKFLVAARVDRGGVPVGKVEIDKTMRRLGFDEFFQTSAKDGIQISDLAHTIREAIEWENIPTVSSTKLFQKIKTFIRTEAQSGRQLSTFQDLYRSFTQTHPQLRDVDTLMEDFDTCIDLVSSLGLIRRLSFGGFVLLRPETLDAYASAIISSARTEQHGRGYVSEESVLDGDFQIPEDERIENKDLEKILLIATIEELTRHEIALKEGPDLIIPSAFIRSSSDIQKIEGKHAIFSFEGPIDKIFATLAVRLYRGGPFRQKSLLRNAVVFEATTGGRCGIVLSEVEENKGEITVFFDEEVGHDLRCVFEDYIALHLSNFDEIDIQYVVICTKCDTELSKAQMRKRRKAGAKDIICPVCETRIILPQIRNAGAEAPETPSAIRAIEQSAEALRSKDVASTILRGKVETGDYDVFLCYSSEDREAVLNVYESLKSRGVLPWIDLYDLRPGKSWMEELETIMAEVKAALVFIGPNKTGPWERMEIQLLLRTFVERDVNLIPVVLKGATDVDWPEFLDNLHRVDMRQARPDPLGQMMWAITGER